MYPAYRCMDSFPHQGNQMPYTQHYYPSFEGIPFPPQVNVDPSKSPITYETWPFGGNYGCSIPVGCHGCCNHNHFPSYGGFRPPYPHFPSPSPFQCHRGYPSFPETYPVRYVPFAHYSVDQPRFEYEKNHCCGCPNHLCNKKEDKHVKIEEHEPEVKNKSNHSLVPIEFKNYPYPIVWIPPEDMKNREQRDSTEPKLKHGDEYPPDMRAHENLKHLEHEPNVRSGWFPFDINSMGSLKHGGDRNGVQDQPNDDRNRAQDQPNVDKNQFQFPICWLPYKHEEDETRGDKEAKADHESAERSSPNLKVASAQLPSSKVGLKAAENNVNGKTNDVKQQAELHNKGKTKEGEGKARGITVKEIEHSGEKKPSDDGTERQSPSPRNTSKLPPVCLRVDPLPKRKNSHGDLRSPSPSHKEKAQEAFGDRSKSTSSIKESAEVEPNKGKIKVVKVVDGITKQDIGEDCKAQTPIGAPVNLFPKSGEEVSTNQDTSKVVKCDDVREDKEVKAPDLTVESHLGDGESQTEDGGANKAENEIPKEEDKAKRKNLSVAEATVIIQSAYRGFEVRKWEPLKKLKQIAEVKEHVAQIRSQIESLESSFDNRSDDKQKLIIGETIMSLLLKLDTIQGLHPTVRNFRKSMAKELVSLQEKLDSLPTNKSEVSNVKLVEDLSMNTKGDSSFEETGNGNSFAETESNHSNISDLVEPSQCQISNIIEATSSSQIMETSEMKLVKKEACEESEDKIIASPLQSSRELVDKLKDDLNNEVIDDAEMMTLKAQTDGSELKLLVEPMPSAAEENVDSAVVVTMPSCLGDQSAASSEFNQELVIEESPKNELIEIGDCEVLQGKGEVESQSAIDITASNGEIAEANQVQQTVDALNDASGIVDPKHEIGEESNFEGHEDMMAEQEEVQKVGHIHENAKISRADDEIGLGNAPIEDATLKIEEFTVQKHEEKNNTNELLDTSEPEKPQPQLAFAEDDIHDGEACKPEEPHAEFSPLENETHCGEASKTEETWPGLSPALDKNSGQENDDSGITNDEDNCSGQDIKETKECNEESENQEIVGDRREFKELVSVAGNDKVTEQLCGSETSKEALIATQFVPAEAEELPQVEGELFPMSPNYSQVSLGSEMGSESDEKLVEENKKLREIMEKLIETGTEQLTAISNLSSRVKDLEKKLARKKKRTRRFRAGSSCVKHANDALKGTTLGIAV